MAEYPFVIYDTAVFGVTAKTIHKLFAVQVDGDATHDRFFTNMRGNGQFPTNEQFLITEVAAWSDADFTVADLEKIWLNSYLQMLYKDQLIMSVPLRSVAKRNSFGGHFTQAVASDAGAIGLQGDGYLLPKPQLIKGGDSFKVEVGQGTATTAGQNVKVALYGILTM